MKGFGFSIKGLLLAITLTALGLTALLNASWVWTSAVVSVTLLALLAALLAIPCRPSPRRAFWLGFAICGWGYLVLLHTPLGETYRVRSPTAALLEMAYEAISPENSAPAADTTAVLERTYEGIAGRVEFVPPALDGPSSGEFHRLGNYLWAWLLAVVGGFAARYFYVAQERRTENLR